ncbi:MAG: bifunctional [glutamine synthetase] adenylyltransferase/[glutamine synthetase]-adenylyl-L-tyrosine phosphorylase [Rhodospirillaceae bacterium]|nr:bifunctional [glutamine synthetase] adenylyltransferase/[glutamine synthetase]-adenylyl-L-tyrosine phosphorylase [Rhodospirillaceae bacterium]
MIPFSASALPPPADRERAARLHSDWLAAAESQSSDLAGFMRAIQGDRQWRSLMDGVFGNSAYVSDLLFDQPAIFMAFAKSGPGVCVEKLIAGVTRDLAAAITGAEIAAAMAELRRAKAEAALLIALADISGIWSVDQVTAALSDFADACVRRALRILLLQAHSRGQLKIGDLSSPEVDVGYAVLGLGKLGGRELNYSSDIDLFVFYDERRLPYVGKKSPQEFAIQLTKDLTHHLQERTAQGYVFRTDLRLRPDPGSTAIAVSREAAQVYYESYGQNWERAAMIKARAIAGDMSAAAAFIHDLQPFIWRKSLDFYAIQDIHSIKRQIYAHKGGGKVEVAGHNIKLGRGGIRGIEFFAQIQQLIWGGRFTQARPSQTLEALAALTSLGFVAPTVRDDLNAAYRYLRKLEHRLQMIADEQTQTLPADLGKLAHVAAFMGHAELQPFMAEVEKTLRTVEIHYAGLFEDSPSLAVDGNLVFTGTEDDPDTIATLKRLGYQNPATVAQTVRGWHHGRTRATRSDRARQLLTEVMPGLLSALGKTAQPDAAFARFDQSLSVLPAGVPLLSMFQANPSLLDLVAEIMGDAPRLAEHLGRSPALLEYVLAPEFYFPVGSLQVLQSDLERTLAASESFEAILDSCRRWTNEQRFRVGVQVLRRMIDLLQAAEHFTAIAEATVLGLTPRVRDEFVTQFGEVPSAGFAILGYGKLGSFELTPTSDLDLVVIYDASIDGHSAGGAKTLPAPAYFVRLTQRLIAAFTLLTREGTLYALDLRLRPTGETGPLACSLDAFEKYHAEDAWTWEHMALTRARTIYGPPALREKIEASIRSILARARDPAALVYAVDDMRARMRREQPDGGLWDLKRSRGGLIDAEFILQYLLLRHGSVRPVSARPADIVASLASASALAKEDAETLKAGIFLWSRLQVLLRLMTENELPTADMPLGLKQKLAAAAGMPDFVTLESLMRDTADAVSNVLRRTIAEPAQAARGILGPDAPH